MANKRKKLKAHGFPLTHVATFTTKDAEQNETCPSYWNAANPEKFLAEDGIEEWQADGTYLAVYRLERVQKICRKEVVSLESI